MMKKLLLIGMAFLLLLSFSKPVVAASQSDMQKLIEFALSDKAKELLGDSYYVEPTRPEVKSVILFDREQLSLLKDWRYDLHYFSVADYGGGLYKVVITLKEKYDALSSNAHTYVEWIFADYYGDGTVERYYKDWVIVTETESGPDGKIGYKLIPQWPPGLRQCPWFRPTKEQAQAVYDKEIKYWIEKLNL